MVIQVYITSARRAYGIADHYRRARRVRRARRAARDVAARRGERARRHDLPRTGRGHLAAVPRATSAAARRRASTARRCARWPGCRRIRRDLIKRHLYLVPNSIVVSRGCPHVCDFCYKEAFFEGGRSLLHADGRRRARRDRPAAGASSLLPRRSPVRRPPLRLGAVRRDARHGPAVAGGRHGQRGARSRICSSRRSTPACAACSSASRR